MDENTLVDLLDRLHSNLLLHPDAGTTRMESKPDFWNAFYGFEKEVSAMLEAWENE